MEWQFVVAIIVAVPVILFPAALIWYMNLSGLWTVMKDVRAKATKKAKTF